MLRITAGDLRGFKIDVPPSEAVRPPLEMARQAIFNILGQDLEGLLVLDLFAGSGVMGIEALSRGADEAVFVEQNRHAVAVMKKNLEKTRLTDRATVVASDAFYTRRYLRGLEGVDIIFLDPPFDMIRDPGSRERISELIDELFESDALASDAVAVLRVPRGETISPEPSSAGITDDRNYGHSRVIFYERKPAEEADTPEPEEDQP